MHLIHLIRNNISQYQNGELKLCQLSLEYLKQMMLASIHPT